MRGADMNGKCIVSYDGTALVNMAHVKLVTVEAIGPCSERVLLRGWFDLLDDDASVILGVEPNAEAGRRRLAALASELNDAGGYHPNRCGRTDGTRCVGDADCPCHDERKHDDPDRLPPLPPDEDEEPGDSAFLPLRRGTAPAKSEPDPFRVVGFKMMDGGFCAACAATRPGPRSALYAREVAPRLRCNGCGKGLAA
jgi:hypothetical protein